MIAPSGLWISFAGGVAVALGVVGLALLPNTGPAIAMMLGGVAVIVGFAMTLAHYYISPEGAGDRDDG